MNTAAALANSSTGAAARRVMSSRSSANDSMRSAAMARIVDANAPATKTAKKSDIDRVARPASTRNIAHVTISQTIRLMVLIATTVPPTKTSSRAGTLVQRLRPTPAWAAFRLCQKVASRFKAGSKIYCAAVENLEQDLAY